MGGVYNGDPSIRDNSNHGVDFSMDGPLFAIAEVAYQPNSLPGDHGLPPAITRPAFGARQQSLQRLQYWRI